MEQSEGFRIEPLGSSHDRTAFLCGVETLDKYLRTQASQDAEKRVAVCFVLTPDGRIVAGYYTLSQYVVDRGKLPEAISRKLPKYPQMPATLLGRLAVSEQYRGQKLGELLLVDALSRSLAISKQIGSVAVIVDAKDDSAQRFYEHFDFMSLPDAPNRLFLPMKKIERMFRSV